VVCLGPRVPGEIVGPRPLSDVVVRPLNFTVSCHAITVALLELSATFCACRHASSHGCGMFYNRRDSGWPLSRSKDAEGHNSKRHL
jgi:hypothetical protein